MGAVTAAFVQQYVDTITQLVQQKMTKLRASVKVDTNFVGEYKFYDQLGATTMQEKVSRHQDTPIIDPDHKRRRVAKRDFIHNTLFDKEDQLNMIVDPKSDYAQAAAMAAGRQMDDVIIAAYVASASTGKTGSGSQAFANDSATNVIAVGGTGLTQAKLIEAKQVLDNLDVDDDDRFCVCTPAQISDLLNTTESTSSDFNTVKTLVQGQVDTWLGFKFIRISSSRLPVLSGTSNRGVYCYHRAAMQLAIQKEASARIDERPDKNYAWQVFMSLSIGAVRLEEDRIVQIACSE